MELKIDENHLKIQAHCQHIQRTISHQTETIQLQNLQIIHKIPTKNSQLSKKYSKTSPKGIRNNNKNSINTLLMIQQQTFSS